eukprot:gene1225-8192_t
MALSAINSATVATPQAVAEVTEGCGTIVLRFLDASPPQQTAAGPRPPLEAGEEQAAKEQAGKHKEAEHVVSDERGMEKDSEQLADEDLVQAQRL